MSTASHYCSVASSYEEKNKILYKRPNNHDQPNQTSQHTRRNIPHSLEPTVVRNNCSCFTLISRRSFTDAVGSGRWNVAVAFSNNAADNQNVYSWNRTETALTILRGRKAHLSPESEQTPEKAERRVPGNLENIGRGRQPNPWPRGKGWWFSRRYV